MYKSHLFDIEARGRSICLMVSIVSLHVALTFFPPLDSPAILLTARLSAYLPPRLSYVSASLYLSSRPFPTSVFIPQSRGPFCHTLIQRYTKGLARRYATWHRIISSTFPFPFNESLIASSFTLKSVARWNPVETIRGNHLLIFIRGNQLPRKSAFQLLRFHCT